jgi:3-oxoacyl-[acyl-carrier protein] reductase
LSTSQNQTRQQVILITGAARGIGRAIAEKMAAAGHFLALNDIDRETLCHTIDTFQKSDSRIIDLVGDVSQPENVEAMATKTVEHFGRIDSLVNNAGIGGTGKFLLELSVEEWNEMLRVDLTSTFLLCKAVLPSMISRGRGRIVNIASITAMMGVAGSTHYAAAKAGVIGFSKSLAREVADKRINVNVVAPGLIDTVMARKRGIDHQRHFVAWPRIGEPEDVASVVAFLLSDEAEFITGQVLSPNGGAFM